MISSLIYAICNRYCCHESKRSLPLVLTNGKDRLTGTLEGDASIPSERDTVNESKYIRLRVLP